MRDFERSSGSYLRSYHLIPRDRTVLLVMCSVRILPHDSERLTLNAIIDPDFSCQLRLLFWLLPAGPQSADAQAPAVVTIVHFSDVWRARPD